MLKKTFLASLLGLSLGFITYVPTLEAQTTSSDDNASVMQGLSLIELPTVAGTVPTVDPDNLQTPQGKLDNPDTLIQKSQEATVSLVNSLTKVQRAKIRAILDDNQTRFKTQLDQLKQATKDKDSIPDPESLKNMGKSTDDLIAQVNDEIRGVLTKQQRAKFEDTLPKRLNLEELGASGASNKLSTSNCYYAFYYYYYYSNYYAYYAYYNALYDYYYYSAPANYYAYLNASGANDYSYYAAVYAYYAYYYGNSTYAYYAYYYGGSSVADLAAAAAPLASRSYYWTGSDYAYYAYYYSYWAWHYAKYYAEKYTYACYFG